MKTVINTFSALIEIFKHTTAVLFFGFGLFMFASALTMAAPSAAMAGMIGIFCATPTGFYLIDQF